MPSKTTVLSDKFISRAHELESTRAKIEILFSNGNVDIVDVEQVYAGLFLDIFTEFESLIEELFLGLLVGKLYSPTQAIARKVKFTPSIMGRTVVFGGKDYLSWLPYDNHTVERAKIFFDNGHPFNLLNNSQKDNLKNYHTIRNAIAHKSDFAHKKFQRFISPLTLLPREKTPIGYLRSKPSAASNQTQYEIVVIELEVMANRICA